MTAAVLPTVAVHLGRIGIELLRHSEDMRRECFV